MPPPHVQTDVIAIRHAPGFFFVPLSSTTMPILTAIEPPGSSAPVIISGDIPENQHYLHDVHASEPPDNETTNVPVICLDLDIIPNTIASKLARSFTGHVLFLKSQVPL
ncbi:hypothetical protein AX16_008632 [Volvariella volvacea WC 439]|nr:hypothetical protein AX16_008632 [Volvariella volvacea WC 439]